VVVPVVYCYIDDLGAWLRRLLMRTAPKADAAVSRLQ